MAWHLSVFVVNEPGKLEKITRVLSAAGLNIRAVSMASTGELGVVRVLVNDPDKGLEALRESRFTVARRRILVAQIDDAPANHAMNGRDRPALDHRRERRPVRVVEPGGLPGRFAVDQAVWSISVELHNPVADDLQRHITDLRSFGACGALVDRRQSKKPPGLRSVLRLLRPRTQC